MPARLGTVVAIPTRDELLADADVCDAEVYYRPGAAVSGTPSTVFNVGVVWARAEGVQPTFATLTRVLAEHPVTWAAP